MMRNYINTVLLRSRPLALAIGLVAISRGAPALASGDIVFAAQYFRRSPQNDLHGEGFSHLFRINPDGSGRRQLTFGKQNDYLPSWSPDGSKILFVRSFTNGNSSICLTNARGRGVRTLLTSKNTFQGVPCPSWSPNGKIISVVCSPQTDRREDENLYLIDVSTGKIRKTSSVTQVAWSPDSGKLYTRGETQSRIVNLKTGLGLRVFDPVTNPVWLDNHCVAGIAYGREDPYLRIVDETGAEKSCVNFKSIDPGETIDGFFDFDCHAVWAKAAGQNSYIMQSEWDDTDGTHESCYLVDLKTGLWNWLGSGQLIGRSPDRKRFAIADHDWIDEKNQNGWRVGALEIITVSDDATRKITTGLVDISGGDWRGASRTQVKR